MLGRSICVPCTGQEVLHAALESWLCLYRRAFHQVDNCELSAAAVLCNNNNK